MGATPVSLCSRFTRRGLESATLPRELPGAAPLAALNAAAKGGEGVNGNRLGVALLLLLLLFCFMEWVMLANGNGAREPGLTKGPPERKGRGSRGPTTLGGATTFGERNPLVEAPLPTVKGLEDAPLVRAGEEDVEGADAGEPRSASPAAFWRMISLGGSP